jgi:enoyl-CoA hydratase/carnithine racemase
LNRPEQRNCLDLETVEGLIDGLAAVEDDGSFSAVTLQGAGGNFSVGADLNLIKGFVEDNDYTEMNEFIGRIHDATRMMEKLDIPVVAVVDGYALAGGIEVLLATDLRIATESARIGDQHANFGLVAGGGGTQRLVRQIDTVVANDLMLTGRRLSGTEAADVGIVNRAVPDDDLEEAVANLETTLSERSRNAAALTKRLMREGQAVDLEHGLQLERHATIPYYFSDDAREGLAAFSEGRAPKFE